MRNGLSLEDYLDQVFVGIFSSFPDGLSHFVSLTRTDADLAVSIADNDDGVEAEATPALDHFSAAVDGDHLLLEFRLLIRIHAPVALRPKISVVQNSNP